LYGRLDGPEIMSERYAEDENVLFPGTEPLFLHLAAGNSGYNYGAIPQYKYK
jgi:hypothetical protein